MRLLTNAVDRVWLGYDTNANGQLETGEYAFYLDAKVLRWDRLIATNTLYSGVAEDATEEEVSDTLYLLTNTNGMGQISLNEKLWPGPVGLQTVCPYPGPLPGDTGTYANLRFYWALTNQNGGAGTGVTTLVSAFSSSNNYYPANIGQVKYVAQPFYDRLHALNLTNIFTANMPGYYPWGNAPQTNDYAPANIGQVKYVFSFDSAKDSDGDGLSDWQEAELGTNPYNPDTDEDGLSDGWEVARGTDPLDENDYNQTDRTSEVEEARQRIIQHWLLFYGSAPSFTNTPASLADLIDLRNALNTLSEKFYTEE